MSDASAIRNGLVANLAPLLKENGGPVGIVSPYMLSSLELPYAAVSPGEVSYDLAMRRGLDKEMWKVTAVFSAADQSQQEILDDLRDGTSGTSVKTLLESDATLGGACQALQVTSSTEPRLYERAQGGTVLGCEWLIDIYT